MAASLTTSLTCRTEERGTIPSDMLPNWTFTPSKNPSGTRRECRNFRKIKTGSVVSAGHQRKSSKAYFRQKEFVVSHGRPKTQKKKC